MRPIKKYLFNNNHIFYNKYTFKKYKPLLILILFILIMILVFQGICYTNNVFIPNDPYYQYQPMAITLSKDSIMRLLPESKFVTIPPFQNLVNQ